MKKFWFVLAAVLFLTLGLWGKTYELTEVDIFSLKEDISSADITVLGVHLGMPVPDVLKLHNLTQKDIFKKHDYLFLDIKPGFRLRLKNKNEIAAIIIDIEFRTSLKGETAKYFDTRMSADKFFKHVKRYFPNPDDSETKDFLQFVNDKVVYNAGFEFSRFGEKKKPNILFQLLPGIPGAKVARGAVDFTGPAADDSKPDLRKVRWGMSTRQVKQIEQLKMIKDTSSEIVYKDNILGFPVLLGYRFTSDQLRLCGMVFNQEHTNKNDFIDDYKRIKGAFAKKYGEPENDITTWKNKLYQDDFSRWGFAVSLGHLEYIATWQNPRTKISLSLMGDNYEITLVARFESKAVEHQEKVENDETDKF